MYIIKVGYSDRDKNGKEHTKDICGEKLSEAVANWRNWIMNHDVVKYTPHFVCDIINTEEKEGE